MKIHKIGNVQYWYDRSTQCWWCAEMDAEGNQLGDARHAFSKREIILEADEISKGIGYTRYADQ